MTKSQVACSFLYLLVVVSSVTLALHLRAATDISWIISMTVLTLPFSLISLFFARPWISGSALELVIFMYLACAVVNVFGANAVVNNARKRKIANAKCGN